MTTAYPAAPAAVSTAAPTSVPAAEANDAAASGPNTTTNRIAQGETSAITRRRDTPTADARDTTATGPLVSSNDVRDPSGTPITPKAAVQPTVAVRRTTPSATAVRASLRSYPNAKAVWSRVNTQWRATIAAMARRVTAGPAYW